MKGQILQLALILITAGIALMFILSVIQAKNFKEKINLQEVEVMEAKNGIFLTENSMDASWHMSSVQSTFHTGEDGVGRQYWFDLDNKKQLSELKVIGQTTSEGEEMCNKLPGGHCVENFGCSKNEVPDDSLCGSEARCCYKGQSTNEPQDQMCSTKNGMCVDDFFSCQLNENDNTEMCGQGFHCCYPMTAATGAVTDEQNAENGNQLLDEFLKSITGDASALNPVIYEPNSAAFSKYVNYLMHRDYIPKENLLYYIRGVRTDIGGFVSGPYELIMGNLLGRVAQDIRGTGDKIVFQQSKYSSPIKLITFMLKVVQSANGFVEANKELAMKTPTIPTSDKQFWYTTATASAGAFIDSVNGFITEKKQKAAEDCKIDGNAIAEVTFTDAVVPKLVVPDYDSDKFVGNQGGLELSYKIDSKFVETVLKDDTRYWYYNDADSKNEFYKKEFQLNFTVKSQPAVLKCADSNDNLFNFETPKDMLCLNNEMWTCNTPIDGLANEHKKTDHQTVAQTVAPTTSTSSTSTTSTTTTSTTTISTGSSSSTTTSIQENTYDNYDSCISCFNNDLTSRWCLDSTPPCLPLTSTQGWLIPCDTGIKTSLYESTSDSCAAVNYKTCSECTSHGKTWCITATSSVCSNMCGGTAITSSSDCSSASGAVTGMTTAITGNVLGYSSEVVYGCVEHGGARRFCKLYRDTRDIEQCCKYWPADHSWVFKAGTFCIGDGSCDNGVDNKVDANIRDRGERCIVDGTNNRPDCPSDKPNGCCDPNENGASKRGWVEAGHVKSGTECKVCRNDGYFDDNSKCTETHTCVNRVFNGFDPVTGFPAYYEETEQVRETCVNGDCRYSQAGYDYCY
ncbi:MAG: hypothetical protein ABIG30_03920 [Candidatus Aenigmatarchaeota archaeon]